MNNRKKALILTLCLALVLVLNVSGRTLAYYTATGTATNVITTGAIRFKIHEHNGDGVPFPTHSIRVRAGDKVSKRVAVETICSQPFYLRIRLTNGVENADLPVEDIFTFYPNTTDWTHHEDGCYYYNTVLQPGQITNPLIREVEINRERVGKQYEGKTLTLAVTVEAVQSKNNPAEQPWLAVGWPGEGGSV